MKLFECQGCGQIVYFENTRCERCGRSLGYLPEDETLTALEPQGGELWQPLGRQVANYRYCANSAHNACNWLVPDGGDAFCLACKLNRTIPNLADPERADRWRQLELGKRRLVYSLLRLGLPVRPKSEDPAGGLAFEFLDASGQPNGQIPTTGHKDGVVTIDAAEADPAEREQRRSSMREPLRTIAGHFRHEIGHYYWEMFRNDQWLADFRALFGDETRDYGQALQAHYQNGPPPNWRDQFVSAYASSHPWEDWAETWAHYLHIVDTMETAYAFGVQPKDWPVAAAELGSDPYDVQDFDSLIEAWLPLTYAVNSLNRSMGQPDLYPFVLSKTAVDKLRFVHDSVRRNSSA
ncbi:MAG: putative zinc-binding peptidase [Bryobacterales bacterium]